MNIMLRRVYGTYAGSARKQRAWNADNPGNTAIRAELTAAVDALTDEALTRSTRILDLGCGTGWWLEHLAERPNLTAELHGIDALADRVALAQRRVPRAAIRLGDARRLPFHDRTVDAVFLFTVLSSMPGRDAVRRALDECRRVLAPDGTLVVWEPRVPNILNRHTRLVTRREFRQALGPEIRIRSLTLLPALARRLGRWTPAVYPALCRLPILRTHRVVVFRKPTRTTG